jgi:hypothetical protein
MKNLKGDKPHCPHQNGGRLILFPCQTQNYVVMKDTVEETSADVSGKAEAVQSDTNAPHSHKPKTSRNLMSYVGIGLIGATVISVKAFNIDLYSLWQHWTSKSEVEPIATFHPGDSMARFFHAKVPIANYTPGEGVGFEIMDTQWRHPFWQTAVVKDGWVYCDFGIGTAQDIGRTYTITGYRLPPGVPVPKDGELSAPLSGDTFYGPALHKRL